MPNYVWHFAWNHLNSEIVQFKIINELVYFSIAFSSFIMKQIYWRLSSLFSLTEKSIVCIYFDTTLYIFELYLNIIFPLTLILFKLKYNDNVLLFLWNDYSVTKVSVIKTTFFFFTFSKPFPGSSPYSSLEL